MKLYLILLVLLIAGTTPVSADLIPFILDGNAGLGLLPGNENPAAANGTPGTGGISAGGIVLDTDTNMLNLNFRWGSGNGFTDLTGAATAAHIHGLTAAAPGGFTENAGVIIPLHTLAGFNADAANGGFSGMIAVDDAQEAAILGGLTYVNVHTALNGPGEIRGHLVAVPEPGTFACAGVGCLILAVSVCRRRRMAA